MNVTVTRKSNGKFVVYYTSSSGSYNETVDETTARWIERAKEAGRQEKAKEIRDILDIKK